MKSKIIQAAFNEDLSGSILGDRVEQCMYTYAQQKAESVVKELDIDKMGNGAHYEYAIQNAIQIIKKHLNLV